MCYKCLVLFFCRQTHWGGNFFSVKFYYAGVHGDGFTAPMQSLWLEFYWKLKVFTEISVNEQTTKHSSEVSQISNELKQ